MLKAEYTRLKREDTLGIRITADSLGELKKLRPGDELDVEKKDGKVNKETIDRIVFSGEKNGEAFALATMSRDIK
jgi:hypothetical protein